MSVHVPVCVCVYLRAEFIHERHYRSPGRKAGHSWPQGSPDYVYDSGAIIRARLRRTDYTHARYTQTHGGWPRAPLRRPALDVSTITLEDPARERQREKKRERWQ